MQQVQTGDQSYFRGYYIVFHDHGPELSPILSKLFTRPGFGHCSIYMETDRGLLNVDLNTKGVEFYFWDFGIGSAIKYFLQKKYRVIYLPTVRLKKADRRRIGVWTPSCVSFCQNITGVTFNCITPYGYYKSLIRAGYQEITHEHPETRQGTPGPTKATGPGSGTAGQG